MDLKSLIIVLMVVSINQTNGYSAEDETKNSARFSFDFYRSMFDQNQNTIVSPFSFRVLLSVLYQSVIGSSETELREKVYLGEKHETYDVQRTAIQHISTSPNMKIVNKIFLKNDGNLKQDFLAIIEGLRGNIQQVDFSQSAATANLMNSWVEEQTNGFIQNLVTEDAVTADTALFLINTLYFKAQWKTPFSRRSVYLFEFTGIDGHSYRTETMFDHGQYNVAELNNFNAKVLEIPYTERSNFVFWVVLPNEDSDIMHLKESLSYDFINETTQNFRSRTYDINIPKFEIESSVDGVETLQKLGIRSIFNNYESYMLDGLPLKVDDIKQKSKIIVNTDGTEVAFGSYTKLKKGTIWPRFSATRPFIYMVLTADTYEPVFIGHYSKPN